MGNSSVKRLSLKKNSDFNFQTICKYIDLNSAPFIKRLSEAIAIKSISTDSNCQDETLSMVHFIEQQLKDLSFETSLIEIRDLIQQQEEQQSESIVSCHAILLAELGSAANGSKKTILIYGHLDVYPADQSDDRWQTDPFVLMEQNGQLFGRGVSECKGSVIAWVNAIQAYQANGMELPVNVKFVLESAKNSGSIGLSQILQERKESFFSNIDYICINGGSWLGTKKPCLIYGHRGLTTFKVEIESANQDLDSDAFGGCVYESMTDLLILLSKLVDNRGKILIPDVENGVPEISKEEEKLYENLDCEQLEIVGVKELIYNSDKLQTLLHRWRYPSLSIHCIQGSSEEEGKIPGKVSGKFSIRLVPNQEPEKIKKLVSSYLIEEYVKLNNPNNKLNITMEASVKPWLANTCELSYMAAKRAIKLVYGTEPDLIREGRTIPITGIFREILGSERIPILILPMGSADDCVRKSNERLDKQNFIEGTKVMATFLYKLGKFSSAASNSARMDQNNNSL